MRKKYKILALLFVLTTAVVLSSLMDNQEPIKKNEAYYQVQFCEKVNGLPISISFRAKYLDGLIHLWLFSCLNLINNKTILY